MGSDSSPLSNLEKFDKVADGFERALKVGDPLAIEDLLEGVLEPGRAVLLRELLTIELEYRIARGDPPGFEEYRRRFPLDQRVLAQAFDEANKGAPTQSAVTPGEDSTSRDGVKAEVPASAAGIPTQIGRYRIRSWLGGGTFGRVYLAHDDQMDRPVAIKVPSTELLASRRARDEFIREARSVSRFSHEAIVRAYDLGEEPDGLCYIVYEYIDGNTLSKRMQHDPMSPDAAALLVAQVADGLHEAHLQGLFHRDIKPANILLDRQDRPHLADFGLAVRDQELWEQRGRRAGTYPYMAPEQVRREGHLIDGRADIYSLGVVLYELLCGRRPFVGETERELAEQILRREARPLRQINDAISPELERICLKAIAKHITDRYTTAKDMAEELRRAVISRQNTERNQARPNHSEDAIPCEVSFETILGQPAILEGSKLGRYVPRSFVASGGTAMVYRALNSTTGEDVCLKIFHPFANETHASLATRMIARAIRAMTALKHPNIAMLLDFFDIRFRDHCALCLISSWVPGKTLDRWCRDPSAHSTMEARLRLARAVAEALSAAHDCRYLYESGFEYRGLLHGDIKPSNIIVRSDDSPALVDFMLVDARRLMHRDARISRNDEPLSTVFGTPGFMSPEQEKEGIVTVRSDVYSLGRTFQHLFLDDSPEDTPNPALSRDRPPKLRELLDAMTSTSPDQRPQDMHAVVQKLTEISAELDGLDNVQFTVYRPKVVRPLEWYTMLAFAHLGERPPDAPAHQPDPIVEVERQARQVLGKAMSQQKKATQDSRHAVPRAGELTFVPDVPGIEFDPPRCTFVWADVVHRKEFRIRANKALDGRTARGALTVYLGSIILAEISLNIPVDSAYVPSQSSEPPQSEHARAYRKIFASYSREDERIVSQFESVARVLGDDFIHRFTHLRAGEFWSDSVARLIEGSDIFQLFWSSKSMFCPLVRSEWEHALSLGRPGFVRPTYWEEPMPTCPEQDLPPKRLREIHFQRLPALARTDVRSACLTTWDRPTDPVERLESPSVQPLTFGKYVVQKVIGRGAFGTRYLAVDPNTEQLVHVRVIEAGSRLSREKVESAINETNQLAKLKHPGIATLREFGVDEGSYFIVSDYVEGISLVHWIDQHRTAYDAISGVAAGIADALSYLHRHGVVHREVLTSNILIRADSSPVLLMAGTQNRFIDISSTFMMGSPAYMAPEQLRGQQVDGRADIYSLGVVLYEMLSGRTPYEGGLFEQMKHALQGEPTPPRQFNPSIPLDLECICLRAMAKHPSQRYATAVDLAAELRIRDAASGPMRGDRHDRFDDTDSSPPALTSAPFERVPTASIDAERPVVSSAESPLKPRYRSADRPNIRGTMAPPESEAPSMRRHTWKERTASEPRESSARTRRPWVIIVPIVTAIVLLVAWWCLAK